MKSDVLNKIIFLFFIIAFMAVFFVFDLNKFFTLSYIKESRENLYAFYAGNRILTIILYMFIYIVITTLSLPGATIMTLAGGGLFGFIAGLFIVSFASSIGATFACFVSRYLLRGWVEEKFGDKLNIINSGMENEGIFYLFMLRLIPVFPFFVINSLMGLTRIKLFTFYWVSQIGMLAGTAVYVNAGKELGKIDSLKGILSPGLILSFIILGIFPLAIKKIVNFIKAHSISRSRI